MNEELRCEKSEESFIIYEKTEHLVLKIGALIAGFFFIQLFQNKFEYELLYWAVIGFFVFLLISLLIKTFDSIKKNSIIKFDKKNETIELYGEVVRAIDEIEFIVLEEKDESIGDDAFNITYYLNLETKDNRLIEIHQSKLDTELSRIGYELSNYLGVRFLKVSVNESKARAKSRSYERLVKQFEKKFDDNEMV